MNRRAAPPPRVDEQLPPTTFNRSFMLVKPSPGPLIIASGALKPAPESLTVRSMVLI